MTDQAPGDQYFGLSIFGQGAPSLGARTPKDPFPGFVLKCFRILASNRCPEGPE